MEVEFEMPVKLSPAADIVRKFQRDNRTGEAILGPLIGLDRTTIYRWQRPLEDGGSGGIIPAKHIRGIIDAGRGLKPAVHLVPADFIPDCHPRRIRKSRKKEDDGKGGRNPGAGN